MPEGGLRTVLILLSGFLLWTCLLLFRPGYLSSPTTLGGLMVAQIILIGIVKYRQIFFTVLLGAFVWAGFDLPYQQSWLQVRWFVLAMGSVTGLAVYMKDRAHHFGLFHLVALFCVLSASVSALVSAYPEESLLKTLSLLLLFV
ncbi:MAG TPA: hypothetical protein VFB00_06455, partial [Terriglobales bacterium]|nr:hypothetical protein [Terriglobales bacterium]